MDRTVRVREARTGMIKWELSLFFMKIPHHISSDKFYYQFTLLCFLFSMTILSHFVIKISIYSERKKKIVSSDSVTKSPNKNASSKLNYCNIYINFHPLHFILCFFLNSGWHFLRVHKLFIVMSDIWKRLLQSLNNFCFARWISFHIPQKKWRK